MLGSTVFDKSELNPKVEARDSSLGAPLDGTVRPATRTTTLDLSSTYRNVVSNLPTGNMDVAADTLAAVPNWHAPADSQYVRRSLSTLVQMAVFQRDHFICVYCGRRTVLPLILRLLSISLEEVFPYDPHWKMSDCHLAFWRDSASCDHRIPVARFGTSKQDNLVTSCYMCNSMKQNWTVEELGWKVNKVSPGETWDGLANSFPMLLKTCADRFENAGIPYFQDWLGSVQATAEPAVLAGKACE